MATHANLDAEGQTSLRRLWIKSAWVGWRERRLFDHVRTFCLFIGYPRSGSSLIGSLLDAHPNAAIAHELEAVRYLQHGFRRRQIFHLALENARRHATLGSKASGGYSYDVPNQWQGRFHRLEVIGDKRAGGTAVRLGRRPELLARALREFGESLRFIHVVRHPFDNISTIAKRLEMPLEEARERYFHMCESSLAVSRTMDSERFFAIRHEEVVADPKRRLRDICEFLGLGADDAYLEDCASIVNESAHRSRNEAPWTPSLIASTQRRMDEFPFLHGYRFDQ